MGFLVLLLFFAILFGAHWLVYCFFVCVLDIRSRNQKYFLRVSLLFLATSFILATVLSSFWENIVTKIVYIAAGLWIGLLINLSMFIGAFWLLKLIFKIIKKDFNKKIYSRIFLALAICYTVLGVINVFNVKTTEVTVKIENLPQEWQGKKIVQLSDVHLGRVLGQRFFNNITDKVNVIDPELIVITGDLFDAMDGALHFFIEPLNKLKSKQGVYYVTGNHEIYLGLDEVGDVLAKTEINVLNDKIALIDGLQFIGISYPEFNEEKDISTIIREDKNFSQDNPSILLYHAPINILQDGNGNHSDVYINPDVDFKGVRDLGIDLQLSGHTHKGQIFPFGFITNMIFGGYDYGLHEMDDFSIYTTSGTGVWGPTMRTSGRSEIVVITLEKK